MYLYTATEFVGEPVMECDEGELLWVPIREIKNLNLWEGDRIFLRMLVEGRENIHLELHYCGDDLVEAIDREAEK